MSERDARRGELWSLLGRLPERDGPVDVRTVSADEHEGYVLERLVLDLNGLEAVPAYFARPADMDAPRPAVLYNHYHGGRYELGKDEIITRQGAEGLPSWAVEITQRGWCALCIDHWAFGERRGRPEADIFKEMLWRGRVMWGMMVFDSVRALDYLLGRDDVVSDRVATMGLSMGSTMAWWLGALDERVRVVVDLCCLTEYEDLMAIGNLGGHGIYYYVPDLLNHFTCAEINALIAPRPHLGIAGEYDRLTPVTGLDKIDVHLKQVYADAGAPEAWRLSRYGCGHMETAAMRGEILEWLERWL